MSVLLQVSDAHFGAEIPAVRDALRQLALQERPDVVVWTGDLTQRARREQFSAARRFADSLPGAQTVAMPGNHDIPLYNLVDRLVRPYANYRRAFGTELEPELEREDLLLLLVKTTRRWRHKHGELSPAQVERVAQRLRQASPRQLRVVATHQPLQPLDACDLGHRLRCPRNALSTWAQAGVDVILGGHTHRPRCDRVDMGARAIWIVQAGTSISHRVRSEQPNSVNVLRHESAALAAHCCVERWDFDQRSGRFVCAQHTRAALSR
ncbi:metallophosphoesterase family protein [Azohydromonas caseinilytica]|uniref:Metallophosphoesterase n=1 Tax=Azohydromonas caseinilytica TaxID=2728836 RepID=A0A848FKQ6_9BURK|nr:metallophosphoesterase [Azohydromonas caseinilytica]NML18850.1 metallophosphoesterase [Azohydromonas caseinilytica]